jgi:hypothetical protein
LKYVEDIYSNDEDGDDKFENAIVGFLKDCDEPKKKK